MRPIQNLELHLVHSCNLTCESCSHYSNQGHKGSVSLEEADAWMRLWNRRLAPSIFSLLGGEPTIHPNLVEFVGLAHQCWPQSHIRLVTNGFLLHRHPTLPSALRAANACLYLSIHHGGKEYHTKLQPVLGLIEGWQKTHGIQVEYYHSYENWTRRYKGFGASMEPYTDGDPRQSWEHCPAKHGLQLHEGKLWKCAPLTYLPLQDAKYGLSTQWAPYLKYNGLKATCSDGELNAFLDRQEESYCGMCPAQPERIELPMPLRSVPTRITVSLPVLAGEPKDATMSRTNQTVVAIATVKNEIDIVEAFVRHTLTYANRLVVLDNGSTDGTLAVLRALAAEGLPVTILEDPSLGHYHAQRMTHLMKAHAVEKYGADWVLPLDADEFVMVPDGRPLVGATTPTDKPLALPWHSYVPGSDDDSSERNPAVRIKNRVAEIGSLFKVLVPRRLAAQPDAVLGQGSHELALGTTPVEAVPHDGGYLAHFPVRGPGQHLQKIAIRALQYHIMPEREALQGSHYLEPFELLKQDPAKFLAEYASSARRCFHPIPISDPPLVTDPFPYRGGPLHHSSSGDDATRGWLALLRYAEDLAQRYGVLAQCQSSDGRSALEQSARLITELRTKLDRLSSEVLKKESVIQDQHRQLQDRRRIGRRVVAKVRSAVHSLRTAAMRIAAPASRFVEGFARFAGRRKQ